jgi:hypothetical protein
MRKRFSIYCRFSFFDWIFLVAVAALGFPLAILFVVMALSHNL